MSVLIQMRRRHGAFDWRMPVLAIGCIFLGGMAALGIRSMAAPVRPDARTLYDYTVVLLSEDGTRTLGSGTSVVRIPGERPRTFILACAHEVTGEKTVRVRWRHVDAMAHVFSRDVVRDLALLSVDQDIPPAPLYQGAVEEGERELAIGNPFNEGLIITEGHVGTLQAPIARNGAVLPGLRASSAPVYPGNSGGGKYVERGTYVLTGISRETLTYLVAPNAYAFAGISLSIPADVIATYLKENGFGL